MPKRINEKIGDYEFPQQNFLLGKKARVRFNFHLTNEVYGEIVRSDENPSGKVIIELENGRYVTNDECFFYPIASN
jgi:hypothetical protein